ncbi:MAG: ribosomal-processing cysteine protease Prp [Faecalibacterium sp.]
MIKAIYTELDGPYGRTSRLECSGHACYAPVGQDIVCAGASTLMQALVSLLAGQEGAKSEAVDGPEGPKLVVTAALAQNGMEGAFELAKAGFALLAERYPDNLRFVDASPRGEQGMVDLQLFAEGGAAGADSGAETAPVLSGAQARQAIASGTMKAAEQAAASPAASAAEKPVSAPDQNSAQRPVPRSAVPPRPLLPRQMPRFPAAMPQRGQDPVRGLHSRWAAEEALMRRSQPDFSFQKELKNPEMRRLMRMPGMRMRDAYRLAHYDEQLRRTAQMVEQGVVQRIQQRSARPSENGTHPGGAAVTHADVAHMTRAQREALERQALHGAKIRF